MITVLEIMNLYQSVRHINVSNAVISGIIYRLVARDVLIQLLGLGSHRFPMIGGHYFDEGHVTYFLLFQFSCFHSWEMNMCWLQNQQFYGYYCQKCFSCWGILYPAYLRNLKFLLSITKGGVSLATFADLWYPMYEHLSEEETS